MSGSNLSKKLRRYIAAIVVMTLCLTITTFALVYASVGVENNIFRTGIVKINLNDGEPVITKEEFLFEPGMTVVKDFFIENDSTWDVYFRLYMDGVDGSLADVLVITIKDGDTILCTGTANELTRDCVAAAQDALAIDERRELTIWFYFPWESGNEYQNHGAAYDLCFDLCAEAVQTKNNPNRLFD